MARGSPCVSLLSRAGTLGTGVPLAVLGGELLCHPPGLGLTAPCRHWECGPMSFIALYRPRYFNLEERKKKKSQSLAVNFPN